MRTYNISYVYQNYLNHYLAGIWFIHLNCFPYNTNRGLFFSRTPDQFKQDLNDLRYDTEKRIGLHFIGLSLPTSPLYL